MFHRAASTAIAPPKQAPPSNPPFKLSQSTLPKAPLSPRKSSIINAGHPAKCEGEKPKMSLKQEHAVRKTHALLDAIHDNAPTKYETKVLQPEVPAVYFNEDDFDDDMDLDFDTAPEPKPKSESETPSSAVSWPPSSYTKPSPIKIQTTPRASTVNIELEIESSCTAFEPNVKLEDAFRSVQQDEIVAVNGPSEFMPPRPKKPRVLPWTRNACTQPPQLGPQSHSRRMVSSAALATEDDQDIDFREPIRLPEQRDPHEITQSAMKAAIKGKGRKRALDDAAVQQTKGDLKRPPGAQDVAKLFLSAEQRGVIEMLKTGKSVFFTGSAGTGKSVLLRTAIQELRQKYGLQDKVAVTASTGLAACNIGGITLHSFAAIGLGNLSIADSVKKVKSIKKNLMRWTKTKVLIIDEISMVDAEFYDKLEAVARTIRGNAKPWGGIQIVATGDFFQLPPVPDKTKVAKFAFEAEKWKSLDATIQLNTVFRQKDQEFVDMLNEMRIGRMSEKTAQNFRLLARPLRQDDGIIPTELFPTRNEVDRANALRMSQLPGEIKRFEAEDSGSAVGPVREKLLAHFMAPQALDLKKGAQVMLIKNRDDGLVNGSLGVVIGFMNERTYTYAHDDMDGSFDDSILRDSPWTDAELAAMDSSPAGKRKIKKLMELQGNQNTQRIWPVVRFRSANGQDITQLMSPESWKVETPHGDIQASRKQVPLILAYAISIHKAQGQTIERVKVDLGKVFEKGQAYVALSRAVSKEGLQVLRFDPKKVMAHPKVASFYRELCDATVASEQSAAQSVKVEARPKLEDSDGSDAFMSTQEVFDQIRNDPLNAYRTSRVKPRA